MVWLGVAWIGVAQLGLACIVVAWLGLAWLGLAWLACIGVAWLGLAWLINQQFEFKFRAYTLNSNGCKHYFGRICDICVLSCHTLTYQAPSFRRRNAMLDVYIAQVLTLRIQQI